MTHLAQIYIDVSFYLRMKAARGASFVWWWSWSRWR